MAQQRDRPGWRVVRIVAGAGALLLGGGIVVVTIAIGHCSAFGGRCPSPQGLTGDLVGWLAVGALLAVGGPLVAARPDRHGLVRGILAGGGAAALTVAVLAPALVRG